MESHKLTQHQTEATLICSLLKLWEWSSSVSNSYSAVITVSRIISSASQRCGCQGQRIMTSNVNKMNTLLPDVSSSKGPSRRWSVNFFNVQVSVTVCDWILRGKTYNWQIKDWPHLPKSGGLCLLTWLDVGSTWSIVDCFSIKPQMFHMIFFTSYFASEFGQLNLSSLHLHFSFFHFLWTPENISENNQLKMWRTEGI